MVSNLRSLGIGRMATETQGAWSVKRGLEGSGHQLLKELIHGRGLRFISKGGKSETKAEVQIIGSLL